MTALITLILALLAALPLNATMPLNGAPSAGYVRPLGAPLSGTVGTPLIAGNATWYVDPKHPSGFYAAAGPLLRVGDWRGERVRVTSSSGSVVVTLTDFCACGDRHGIPTVLDLSADAFSRLAPLSTGIVAVEVEVLPKMTLPATDTEEGYR